MAKLLVNGVAPTNPASLGFIKPTAGTPLQVINNYTDLGGKYVHAVTIQADAALTGGHYVYVLVQQTATAADTTNGLNIIAKLAAGQAYAVISGYGNQILMNWIWVDCTNTGDIAICSYVEY